MPAEGGEPLSRRPAWPDVVVLAGGDPLPASLLADVAEASATIVADTTSLAATSIAAAGTAAATTAAAASPPHVRNHAHTHVMATQSLVGA